MNSLQQIQYECASGIGIRRSVMEMNYAGTTDELAHALDTQRGVLLASSFEYPGRYTRWDIGFANPPLQLIGRGRTLEIEALNTRGEILLPEIYAHLENCAFIAEIESSQQCIRLSVAEPDQTIAEEMRSRRYSLFSALRQIVKCFHSEADQYLGLYGAFGYDLTFQFEDVKRYQQRDAQQRDLVLYLPDQITVVDHRVEKALCYSYEFVCRSWESDNRTETTGGYGRTGRQEPYAPAIQCARECDHAPGEYAEQVEKALNYFARGDLFEVVPGQVFFEPCADSPARVFSRLKQSNPAPYGALMNLGEQEYLVAASPEIFVRVEGDVIETCPISGTIKRGSDAIADAQQIKTLLNSTKDESELSLCTDVDRNDKARVCVPGSVEVVGRRQIEMYSRLIHTVDHVKGKLSKKFDALDGLLAHTWAVTVTGAPKLSAMQFIEQHEKSPRLWYGGAMGHIGFNGNLNTGLTLRTVRIKDGIAEIRAGATLLMDSDPEAEELETRLKASALLDAIRGSSLQRSLTKPATVAAGAGAELVSALMVDHQDSFVHNLAAYFCQCGVEVITLRPEPARAYLEKANPDLVILSPGPGLPADYAMAQTIELALRKQIALFEVCLGLQGLVEYFGGKLATLDHPVHGKSSRIYHAGSALFESVPDEFTAGRYHSWVAQHLPDCVVCSARTSDDHVMVIEHKHLAVSAVQFHPESIMTLEQNVGLQLINNVVQSLRPDKKLRATG